MTKFQLTEFLTWMTNHQPSSKRVLDEMYVHDVALVMQTVRDEFTRLQAERDEARREICNSKKRRPKTHLDYARKRGWNCFWVDYSKQEETTVTEQDKIVVLEDNHRLRAENDTLRRERDEARREVCRLMSMFNAENSVEIAASRSWDCFKETP